jgi:ATP-dependent DNA ligase
MLPIKTDFPPMEAQLVDEVPRSGPWQYEPKWDGFRCLAFRDGESIDMKSKSGQPLDRYFPEVVRLLSEVKASKFVIDGELVINSGEHFSFDDLLERIHPAPSRIKKLSIERPATFIVFDLLVDEHGTVLTDLPLEQRRELLEQFHQKYLTGFTGIVLSPASTDFRVAEKWWQLVGEGLDGMVAKRLGLPYQSGNRKGMIKIKKLRTADCVVGGFRYASSGPIVGSLLLGLYDNEGLLHHVGFTSAFKAAEKKRLTEMLEPLIEAPGFTGNAPGAPSRWSTKRSEEWYPLKTQLVVEVQYDHFTGDRFRHGTSILRWRPDKAPRQCTFDQVRREVKGTTKLFNSKAS